MAKRSALRNLLTHGFHVLVVFAAGGSVKDTQCGFKVCAVPVSEAHGLLAASRLHATSTKHSALRNPLTRGFHVLFVFAAGGSIKDMQCGL